MRQAFRVAAVCVSLSLPWALSAQGGYRLRVDVRGQAAGFHDIMVDSIPVTDTVSQPGGGPMSPDGFAVQCRPGTPFCTFFRPGSVQRAGVMTATTEVTAWGLGLTGMSVHAAGRVGLDVAGSGGWPGTEPALQLLEGYAEYAAPRVTGRLGRQVVASRLGTSGFDGAGLVVRDRRLGLEAQGFLGWGLARGAALPVTSPALNPLDDFQPRRRQIVAGVGAGWRRGAFDLRADYLREVDPRSDYFVSERLGLAGVVRWRSAFSLAAGADYNLAAGWWGSAEANLEYVTAPLRASLGARRYRPHFDLWTIWGAFSPVPYRAIAASAAVSATRQIELRGRYERYQFDDDEAETPLVQAERGGWRWELGGTLTPHERWRLEGSYRADYGPGAAAAGLGGSVTYAPSNRFTVMLLGSAFNRPLEFRFNEAVVRVYGIDAQMEASDRVRVAVAASYYQEAHRRGDAGAFDWRQLRASARVVFAFGSGADLRGLPPSIRMLPGGRSAR